MSEQLLTYLQVAERLAVSLRTVKRMVATRKLKVVDMGYRTKRVRPADLARCEERLSGNEFNGRMV